MIELLDKLIEKMGYARVKDIEILYLFLQNPPSVRKMNEKRKYFIEHGKFQEEIVLVGNCLIDGYTSYLLAKDLGKKFVKVRRVNNEQKYKKSSKKHIRRR